MAEYIKCRNCESPDCKGCNLKRLDTMLENGKFDCMMNENRCINTSADVEPVQEWISVDDRLPEYPGHYLVCTSINYWHGGCMDINENHKYHPNGTPVGYDGSTMSVLDCYYDVTGQWNRVCDSHVTHWMPLPPPPKGE